MAELKQIAGKNLNVTNINPKKVNSIIESMKSQNIGSSIYSCADGHFVEIRSHEIELVNSKPCYKKWMKIF